MFRNNSWLRIRIAKFPGTAIILALASVVCMAAAFASPQSTEKLPTVQEVLDRYVAVTGGRDALLRYKSMTIHGHGTDPAKNTRVDAVSYTKAGKMLQKVSLPGGKEALSGYDGETAWDIDPSGKVTIAEGDVIKTVARDADMYYHLHVMNYFQSMEVVDVKEFNGRPCYHLKGVNNWANPTNNSTTRKMACSSATHSTPLGAAAMATPPPSSKTTKISAA